MPKMLEDDEIGEGRNSKLNFKFHKFKEKRSLQCGPSMGKRC